MKRGRPKTPTPLKKLQGTDRPDRVHENEPRPDVAIPACPKHLSEVARKEYRRITKLLKQNGLITRLDMAPVAAYCQAYARWVEAEEALKISSSLLIKTPSGYPVQNPLIGIANKQIEIMAKFLAEFGFTPAARARMHTAPAPADKPTDPISQFMSKKKAVNG